MPKAFVEKLRTTEASALGTAKVTVPHAEQEWTDSDGKTVHEVQQFDDGVYEVEWAVAGKVAVPKATVSGGKQTISVVLPPVGLGRVDTLKPPRYNRDQSDLAIWQRMGQEVFGADRTEEQAGQIAFANAIRKWGDSKSAQTYQVGVACTALAAESAKAAGWAEAFGVPANIPQFYGPYQTPPDAIANAPTVQILIPHPTHEGQMLDMDACRPKLADLGYSATDGNNHAAEGFGLPAYTIKNLEVPPRKG
jgi:hypothetical protein